MMMYSRIYNCKNCRTKLEPGKDIFSSGLSYFAKCPKCGKSIRGRGDFQECIDRWNNTKKTTKRKQRVKMVCTHCGSEQVSRDATVKWNVPQQRWVIRGVMDTAWCDQCDMETSIKSEEVTDEKRQSDLPAVR